MYWNLSEPVFLFDEMRSGKSKLRALRSQLFEPFAVDQFIDSRKRYNLELDPHFPFAIKLFSYDDVSPPYSLNWHERLELLMPVAGYGTFLMGDHSVEFEAGDVLIVDNMRLHGFKEFHGPSKKIVVITFMPAFVFTLGSPLCDSHFLAPFYSHTDLAAPIVKSDDHLAPALHEALSKLVMCYFNPAEGPTYRAGCKVYLLEALYVLASRFPSSVSSRSSHLRMQEQARLLGKLHEYLMEHYSEKVSLATACSIVGMSESKFTRFFKAATGETFVSYLTRLRLNRAMQLLEKSNKTIADIAIETGFSDQSYFDRVFRRYFKKRPSDVRRRPVIVPFPVEVSKGRE